MIREKNKTPNDSHKIPLEDVEPLAAEIRDFLIRSVSRTGTPFAACPPGSMEMTLKLLSIFRLMHPKVLLPSTTALATLAPDGRERGILAGANVVMPNLSPPEQRNKYSLYDNKASLGAEAAEGLQQLEEKLTVIGYRISKERGDY